MDDNERKKRFRRRLLLFFRRYDLSRVAKISDIMTADGADEEETMAVLTAQYGGEEPMFQWATAEERSALTDRLERFYGAHEPAKLPHIPLIVDKYIDNPDELFEALMLKYNVTPPERIAKIDAFRDVLRAEFMVRCPEKMSALDRLAKEYVDSQDDMLHILRRRYPLDHEREQDVSKAPQSATAPSQVAVASPTEPTTPQSAQAANPSQPLAQGATVPQTAAIVPTEAAPSQQAASEPTGAAPSQIAASQPTEATAPQAVASHPAEATVPQTVASQQAAASEPTEATTPTVASEVTAPQTAASKPTGATTPTVASEVTAPQAAASQPTEATPPQTVASQPADVTAPQAPVQAAPSQAASENDVAPSSLAVQSDRSRDNEGSTTDCSTLRDRLLRFYAHYDPHRIAHIDTLLVKYKGMEQELFDALTTKYGPEPVPVERQSSSVAELNKSTPDLDSTRRRLERFFSFYNTDKLSALDEILAAYAGEYDIMFSTLEGKYGPEAAIPHDWTGGARTNGGSALAGECNLQEGDPESAKWRRRLQRIFEANDRSQVANISPLLEKYRGMEAQLVDALHKKYRPMRHSDDEGEGDGFGSREPSPITEATANLPVGDDELDDDDRHNKAEEVEEEITYDDENDRLDDQRVEEAWGAPLQEPADNKDSERAEMRAILIDFIPFEGAVDCLCLIADMSSFNAKEFRLACERQQKLITAFAQGWYGSSSKERAHRPFGQSPLPATVLDTARVIKFIWYIGMRSLTLASDASVPPDVLSSAKDLLTWCPDVELLITFLSRTMACSMEQHDVSFLTMNEPQRAESVRVVANALGGGAPLKPSELHRLSFVLQSRDLECVSGVIVALLQSNTIPNGGTPSQQFDGPLAHVTLSAYTQRTERLFRRYQPSKVSSAAALLRAFAGEEEQLIRRLVDTYGPEPTAPCTGEEVQALHNYVRAVYQRHCPDNVSKVDAILEAFHGAEDVLQQWVASLPPVDVAPMASIQEDDVSHAVAPQPPPPPPPPPLTAQLMLLIQDEEYTREAIEMDVYNEGSALRSKVRGLIDEAVVLHLLRSVRQQGQRFVDRVSGMSWVNE